MYTLALETSCDETSAAVIQDGRRILSDVISTQVPIHRKFGGVVPEIASRQHIEYVMPVVQEALEKAGLSLAQMDHIGVTYGPGLVGALLVGVAAAKALSFALDKPLVGVNHMEGHIFANFLSHPDLEPPFLCLVVSGGHTQLVRIEGYNSFVLLGQTRDDAAGEAFDKIARVMGYPYPGGPQIDKLAKTGNAEAIAFPKALHEKHNFEFSFSGLKSAVLNYLHTQEQRGIAYNPNDVAASFQKTVVDTLVEKTMDAASYCQAQKIAVAGGVSANSALAAAMEEACQAHGYAFYRPEPILCTDNAAMIGCRAYYMAQDGLFADLTLNAKPGLAISSAPLRH
ncbi:tRNA (adenosine(37)-N6)-threonylcarbamoyltransferase complex transferase subunit TsaD [uncultured Megasphaera sp.]|uniref:tRNA (adenosine(37)-N6)-threonylcarbamoyltransferase complex transferase subunit TsaD n=1 Tax=uncultured Megasphaera sp. TaxID=165188 RepID=UPI002657B772|nr:tRNA (adenosine(37)-N6)-threonylcarbamoyltransferase complex transferase subunit TsaD [uncultured Megasphaera sp.]